MTTKFEPQRPEDLWIDRILNALQDLEFGSVQIIVHDSKIMQIERTEKLRYPLERTTFDERPPRRKNK
ncbi:YezD family protein [Effusibacillus lacus]|uniref:DUF2292 domain-containing protein n=1 Tax=Effusibacillus lacus TaxID=1348429 RepID=A0A292YC39_9BACL|nr:YezD family protein [Effusibacillus lacus]TCS74273.1 hypothetical protein EDD64_11410 [Effusibacillus lacus]GAX88732.1 hypothetical protein EFBL_0346 [Effusibacillus lacus]